MNKLDGFEIEEMIREGFGLEGQYPDVLKISYNDFVDFCKYLVQETLNIEKEITEECQK